MVNTALATNAGSEGWTKFNQLRTTLGTARKAAIHLTIRLWWQLKIELRIVPAKKSFQMATYISLRLYGLKTKRSVVNRRRRL